MLLFIVCIDFCFFNINNFKWFRFFFSVFSEYVKDSFIYFLLYFENELFGMSVIFEFFKRVILKLNEDILNDLIDGKI